MTDYLRPRTLDEALRLAAAGRVVPAAGCTDLFPATQAPALAGPILDLTGIEALRGIARGPGGWRIGALATWTEVARAALPPAFDGLRAAAREVGSVQIQNAGTVGGNLCNASPAADGVPCLLTLEAEVELASVRGTRRLPLPAFLTGPRQTARAADELLTAVVVPAAAGAGQGAFVKLGARRYLVISIAMVAARLEVADGRIARAAVAVGACSAVAARLPALEAALAGAPAGEAADRVVPDLVAPALAPISDVRADAAYRAEAAVELVRRALVRALPRQEAA
ncbi:MAG: FAD binding domain-containing protein [Rhodobacteraceae bacterium]|nr:FAD binding domain-containing protein [Paracoccaceae bacterium]